jgi:hypothetical protein
MHAKCLLHRDEVTAHKKRRTFFGLMPQGRSANNCCYQLLRNCFLNGWMLPEGWPTRLPAKKFRAGRRRPHARHWQALAGLVGIKD